MLTRLRTWFSSSALAHPKVTWAMMTAGIVSVAQNQHDFEVLFGNAIGPKVAVLVRWFGCFCISGAAAGRSILSDIDSPKA